MQLFDWPRRSWGICLREFVRRFKSKISQKLPIYWPPNSNALLLYQWWPIRILFIGQTLAEKWMTSFFLLVPMLPHKWHYDCGPMLEKRYSFWCQCQKKNSKSCGCCIVDIVLHKLYWQCAMQVIPTVCYTSQS